MDDRAAFGQWLKQRRKALRLTQEALAARLSCSSAMVRKIEAGERAASPPIAALLAATLGVVAGERAAFVQFAGGLLSSDAAQRELWQTLHTAQPHPTNLAAPLTTLIGREHEVARLHTLLLQDSARLLTLTGPPGIGKTRLSLEVGVGLLDHFADGVFFVGLASVVDPGLVLTAIALTLGLPDKGTASLLGELQQALSSKQMLLLLDNFEQVLDAAPFVLALLSACPTLKVLITSREALHVYGEQQFPVPALATVDPENLPPLPTLGSIPALALFTERAPAVQPDIVQTEENARAVAAICTRVYGQPLAIELAAARIRLFSPQEMRARLDHQLALLTGGPRHLPARQRTLRAAIDWSYNLLNAGEQTLFARLSVFVGGCTLAAVAAIGNAQDDLTVDVQDGMESLLDKNLLKREEDVAGESRFTMLEMLREYAVRCLEERGETRALGRHHAAYYLALAEAEKPAMRGPTQVGWFSRIEQEQDNIRVALRWAEANHEPTLGLRLALTLWWFWTVRGNVNEADRWLASLLGAGGTEPTLRANALYAAGQTAWARGDLPRADAYLTESLALYTEVADPLGASRALRVVANLARDRGDYAQSRQYYAQSLALLDEVGDTEDRVLLLISMGGNACGESDYETARSLYERSLKIAADLGSTQLIAVCLSNLGNVAHHEGHDDVAAERFKASLQLQRELREKFIIAECLVGLGSIARSAGQPARTVRLFAMADHLRQSSGVRLNPINRQDTDDELAEARQRLDPATFEQLWAESQAMTLEQALDDALGQPSTMC